MIGEARVDEASAVIALWEACGLTRPWNPPRRDFEQALAGPASTILVARDADAIAGSVMVGFDGHRGWVYYLAVSPDRQGEGLGRALMAAAEDWLRTRDAPKIQLMVRGDNETARGFYEAIGYEVQDVVTIGKRIVS